MGCRVFGRKGGGGGGVSEYNVIYLVSDHYRVKNHFDQSLLPSISQQRIEYFNKPEIGTARVLHNISLRVKIQIIHILLRCYDGMEGFCDEKLMLLTLVKLDEF